MHTILNLFSYLKSSLLSMMDKINQPTLNFQVPFFNLVDKFLTVMKITNKQQIQNKVKNIKNRHIGNHVVAFMKYSPRLPQVAARKVSKVEMVSVHLASLTGLLFSLSLNSCEPSLSTTAQGVKTILAPVPLILCACFEF